MAGLHNRENKYSGDCSLLFSININKYIVSQIERGEEMQIRYKFSHEVFRLIREQGEMLSMSIG